MNKPEKISSQPNTGYAQEVSTETTTTQGNDFVIKARGSMPGEFVTKNYSGNVPTVQQAVEYALEGRESLEAGNRVVADEINTALYSRRSGVDVLAVVYEEGNRAKPVNLNSEQIRSNPITPYVNPQNGEFEISITTDEAGGTLDVLTEKLTMKLRL